MGSKGNKKGRNLSWLWIILLFVGVALLWGASWWYVDVFVSENENIRGVFGDKFGAVNSLFSGLAFAGIIYSIFLQKNELSLQRKELKDTRQEFKEQNFQTTFFNLLKTQQTIVDSIEFAYRRLDGLVKVNNKSVKGRRAFNSGVKELQKIYSTLLYSKYTLYDKKTFEEYESQAPDHIIDKMLPEAQHAYTFSYYKISQKDWDLAKSLEPLKIAEIAYGYFFRKFHFAIGHYFRHIYHILNFLEQAENERLQSCKTEKEKQEVKNEFGKFADFIQAQMSTVELFLLFYNSLSFPKLKRLLIKYNQLENLPYENLLDEEHKNVEGITFKSLKKILE